MFSYLNKLIDNKNLFYFDILTCDISWSWIIHVQINLQNKYEDKAMEKLNDSGGKW